MTHDAKALAATLADAEAVKATLVDERRSKRDSMSRIKFKEYNLSTYDKQIEVQAAVDAAAEALGHALGKVRSDAIAVALGTISESDTAGGG